jgi:hypothetical protein
VIPARIPGNDLSGSPEPSGGGVNANGARIVEGEMVRRARAEVAAVIRSLSEGQKQE